MSSLSTMRQSLSTGLSRTPDLTFTFARRTKLCCPETLRQPFREATNYGANFQRQQAPHPPQLNFFWGVAIFACFEEEASTLWSIFSKRCLPDTEPVSTFIVTEDPLYGTALVALKAQSVVAASGLVSKAPGPAGHWK